MQVDLLLFNNPLGTGIGTDVKTNHNGVGGHRQVGIGFVDTTDAAGHDLDPHLIGGEFGQRIGNGLDRTLHIGLEQNVKVVNLTLRHLAKHVIKLGLLLTSEFHIAEFTLTEQCHLARLALVGHHNCRVTG